MTDINNLGQGKIIVLIDPFRGGHHDLYLSIYSKVLKSLGFRVKITLPVTGQDHSPLLLWKFAAESVKDIISKDGEKPFLVMFLWIDSYLSTKISISSLDKIFPYNWSALYFHPRHLRVKPKFNVFLRLLNADLVLQSRYCKAIGLLDSGVVKKLQNKIQNKPVTAFPDVTDTSLSSKDAKLLAQIRKKVNGRKIVGVLGSMDRRKGVMAMLRLAKIQKGKNLFYIFAGELNKDKFTKNELAFFQATINTNPDNCFFYLKRIPSEGQFNSFLSICDVIYLSYLDFPHSSNLLTKASFFRKSVVVSRGYYMEEVVKKYKLGISIKQNDENEAYEAVRTLLEGRGFEQTGFKKFYDKNSVANLEKVLRKMIESLNQEYENSIR